jgi:hypothetical protein
LGRGEEALAAVEEAIGIYRQLTETLSGFFLPDLAQSLNNQYTTLGQLGRKDEALAIRQEADATIGALAQLLAGRASDQANIRPSDP